MKRLLTILALVLALPATAQSFTVTGRFLYEDRLWNGDGYTGAVQNLPIRRAKVEIVDLTTTLVLAGGYTDANGGYSVEVTGQTLPVSFYARCLTDGRPGYQIWVVDAVERDLMGGWVPPNAPVHAITTDPALAHPPSMNHDFGTTSSRTPMAPAWLRRSTSSIAPWTSSIGSASPASSAGCPTRPST